MNISICITVLNEEGSVGKLLDSLLSQTKKPNEIIIVDGGSTDKTIEIISHYSKRFGGIKLLIENLPRARGRNLAIEVAKGDIIATTDADCIAKSGWLEKLTDPFEEERVGISAGFYDMRYKNEFEKAERVFLGVLPSKFDINFLPSTRSLAFRKKVWEDIGGFPEGKGNSAEDTDFNVQALKHGVKFARVKNAVVEWSTPKTIQEFRFKIYEYARWDAENGEWWHPTKHFVSHNIHSLFILGRYVAFLSLLVLSLLYHLSPLYSLIVLLLYVFWAFQKAGKWGIVLQFVSDFAVMKGFLHGIF